MISYYRLVSRMGWLVLACVACSQPKPPPAPPPPPSACAAVADHLVLLMTSAAKHAPEATDPLRRVIATRCEQDKWSDAASDCLLKLSSLAEGERCQTLLTPAQIEAFQRDTAAAASELHGQLREIPTDAGP